jgi:hypothetical protein
VNLPFVFLILLAIFAPVVTTLKTESSPLLLSILAKGHHGEDNNIYLNDANLNNTKDLATTLGHETSHAIDNQDPSIDTNPISF